MRNVSWQSWRMPTSYAASPEEGAAVPSLPATTPRLLDGGRLKERFKPKTAQLGFGF
jgi:hypothetical protein